MKAPQVCVPSIHKATSNNRFMNKSDIPKKKWHPKDDYKQNVTKLHTISLHKENPFEASVLKEIIEDYYKDTGEKPTIVEHPNACDDHYTGVTVKGLGYVGINWKHGEEFKVY